MFTKNWYKYIASCLNNAAVGTVKTLTGESYSPASYNDAIKLCYKVNSYNTASLHYLRNSLSDYSGPVIGTGTTAPTVDDYFLSGDVITTFTSSVNITTEDTEDGSIITALYTITNTGDSAFTVGEIGLLGTAKSGQNDPKYRVLFERTVLDSPVTIEPGGVGQVTYTIRMNYPT